MDETETYIKMCGKATEIQALMTRDMKRDPRNYAYCPTHGTMVNVIFGEYECVECPVKWVKGDSIDAWIVLPQQDQLITMLDEMAHWEIRYYPPVKRINENEPFEIDVFSDRYSVITASTIEQGLLAAVMSERYQKTWDGENWISSTGSL